MHDMAVAEHSVADPPNASHTARARARAELTQEIKAVARRQLAESGAPSISLRWVARELGMVSSAVYRYFPSRDDLLTALIIDAYDAVGAAGEQALAGSHSAVMSRWLRVAEAIRGWAKANPHEYALIYGSPVPGYRAPQDTIAPAARVSLLLMRLLVDGVDSGEIDTTEEAMPRPVHADLAQLRALAAPGVPDVVLSRGLAAWAQLFGLICLELFGHLHNVVHDYDAMFRHQMRRAGQQLVSRG